MRREICVGAQGVTPRVDDIVASSTTDVDIVLDGSNLTRVKKESPAPKAFVRDTEALPQIDSTEKLPDTISRAATFCVLVRLATGSSGCRAVVLQTLQQLLAEPGPKLALPRTAIDSDALVALPMLLNGNTSAVGLSDKKHAELLGVSEAPGFSASEKLQLLSGSPVSCGTLALASTQAQKLLSVNCAALALSCEALKGSSAMFSDMKLPDVSASKHVSAVASDVITLLEGSSFTNRKPKDGGKGTISSVVKGVKVIGDAQYHANAAYEATRAELMSPAVALPADWTAPVPSAAPLATCGLSLSMSATSAASLALDRCECLKDALHEADIATDEVKAAEEWLQTLEVKKRGHCANVGGASAAVASGALGGDDDPPSPSLQVAEVALAAVEILRECCACECLLASLLLQPALAPPPADAPPAKKKVALGKGTAVLYRELTAAAEEAADAGPGARAKSLLAPQAVGGLAEDLRRVIEANAARRKPKLPKGTKDYLPTDMAVRKHALAAIEAVFERHGAVTIDTPVFELRETLAGKYGEDSKLIYDLADQGGELLSLRYDLTVPFARYVALNGIGHIKRYHIGKVYRRDNPQMNRGRFREFYQCDFDIAGSYPSMVADSEVLRVLHEILRALDIGQFTIKLNHRALLDGVMAIAGVPAAKFRPICSAIDKLDKAPWEEVRREMVEDKGLPGPVADKIGEFVAIKGEPRSVIEQLKAREDIQAHEGSSGALEALSELFGFLEAMGALQTVSFDMSLARGLDYYTGVIYEAVLVMGEGPGASVGSIAAGGRYDGLVGMYSGKDVPAVGVSIGVERVFTVLEAKLRAQAQAENRNIRATKTQVLVGSFGKGLQVERMKLCADLWAAGINAEFGYKRDQNFNKDIVGVAQEHGIPYVVVFGDSELESGNVNVKDMTEETQETVARAELCESLKDKLAGRKNTIF